MKDVTENNYCKTEYIGESLGQLPFINKEYAQLKLENLIDNLEDCKLDGGVYVSSNGKIVTEFTLVKLEIIR